ncbi:MAG: hypothetical protein M1820_003534 [Bogoriella megaspora]|nr:MAG: hypothetical protein M1820_003534 [Bogoriella megaspora]
MELWTREPMHRQILGQSVNSTKDANSRTASQNQTQEIIADLLLNNFQNVRTAHLVLSAFSIAASVIVILSILNDARKAAQYEVALRPRRFRFFNRVHSAEILPLVLSVVIIIQQIVFLVVQASGMNTILVGGCKKTSQVLWPAMFIAPYIVLAFGLETAIRSLMRTKFAPRGKWNLYLILGFTGILTIATWALSAVRSVHDRCFASLPWWVGDQTRPAIVLLSLLMGVFFGLAFMIWLSLSRTVKVEPQERISASRDFYYLILGAVLLSMVLPFYVQLDGRIMAGNFTSSMVAGVVLTLNGMANGFLHLILRGNAARMAIMPIQTPWQQKRSFRLFGPNDLDRVLNISSPLNLIDQKQLDIEGAFHEKDLDYDASPRPAIERLNSNELDQAIAANNASASTWPLNRGMSSVPPTPPPKGFSHKRNESKGNYSLFPTAASEALRPISTESEVESKNELKPPRPFFGRRHKRDSSAGSSATVQIGLRLSLAPTAAAFPRIHSITQALRSPRSPHSPKSPKSPHSPNSPKSPGALKSPASPSPLSREVSHDSTSTIAPLPKSFYTRPARSSSRAPPPHIVTQMQASNPMPAEPTPVLLTSRRYLDNVRNSGSPSTAQASIGDVLQPPQSANGLRQNPPTPQTAAPFRRERSPVWSPLLAPLRSPKSPLRSLNSKSNENWI